MVLFSKKKKKVLATTVSKPINDGQHFNYSLLNYLSKLTKLLEKLYSQINLAQSLQNKENDNSLQRPSNDFFRQPDKQKCPEGFPRTSGI